MSASDPSDLRSASAPAEDLATAGPRPPIDSAAAALPRIAISEALRNDWIEIWYQPKIDLKRKYLAGAEALARIPIRGSVFCRRAVFILRSTARASLN